MFDLPGVLLLMLLICVFVWLSRRAYRAKRPVVKWSGTLLAGLLTLVVVTALGAVLFGYSKLSRTYDNPVSDLSVEITPERVARGERFSLLCAGCHAPERGASMTGRDFLGEGAPPIGRFYAPNLTPVHLGDWSDGELIRAIREGVHRGGRSLLIMPSFVWRNLSDEDVQSIVAYLRSLPEEGSLTEPNNLNILGAAMSIVAPIFEAQLPVVEPVLAPPLGPSAAYGSYVASFTCQLCHGADLLGDIESKTPPLIAIALLWSEQEFVDFMRTGTRPDGSSVDGEAMPLEELGYLLSDDEELRAIYAYLQKEGAKYAK